MKQLPIYKANPGRAIATHFSGKTILIKGAGEIGRATARRLAKNGAGVSGAIRSGLFWRSLGKTHTKAFVVY